MVHASLSPQHFQCKRSWISGLGKISAWGFGVPLPVGLYSTGTGLVGPVWFGVRQLHISRGPNCDPILGLGAATPIATMTSYHYMVHIISLKICPYDISKSKVSLSIGRKHKGALVVAYCIQNFKKGKRAVKIVVSLSSKPQSLQQFLHFWSLFLQGGGLET